MPNPLEFAIAGAGIAGLAGAIALAGAGHEVTVFEQAERIEEIGAGLQVGPNAVRALEVLGVWEHLQPLTVEPRRILIRSGTSGRLLSRIDLGSSFTDRFGAPYRVAHRADLISSLLETATGLPGINLETAATIESFSDSSSKVTVNISGNRSVNADVLIGADGIRSRIRSQLLADGEPVYAGQAIYRALIETIELPDLADNPEVGLWLYPHGHVVHYPVSGGRRLNLVAAVDSPWRETGWSVPTGSDEVIQAFSKATPDLTDLLTRPKTWRKWAGADRPPAHQWGSGNVSIIGDAAHPSLPYLAQGGAMALEDAVELGKVFSQSTPVKTALRSYEAARQSRTARQSTSARRMGKVYHLSGAPAVARNAALSALPSTVTIDRLSWLYNWRP